MNTDDILLNAISLGFNTSTKSVSSYLLLCEIQKWLRDTKNVVVVCVPSSSRDDMKITGWVYDIYENGMLVKTSKDVIAYEEALHNGISKAIAATKMKLHE